MMRVAHRCHVATGRRLTLPLWLTMLLMLPAAAGSRAGAADGAGPDRSGGGRLTLHEAAALALGQHPGVAAAAAARDQARAAAGEARATRLPWVRLTGAATRYEEPMAVAPIHGFSPASPVLFDETLYQANGSLTYTLFDGGGRPARVRQADRRADAAAAAQTAAEQAIVSRVAVTYLDVLARREVLSAHDQRLLALAAEQERVRRHLAEGRAAEVEALRLEAATAAARAERVRLAASLDTAERDLARFIGLGEDEARAGHLAPVSLADTSVAPRGEIVATSLADSPILAQSRWQTQAAQAGVAAARSARWPEVRFVGAYTDYADAQGNETGEWSASLQLSVSLFTGGAIGQAIARARAADREAAERARQTELDLRQELDRAAAAVDEVRARLGSLRAAVASYAEVARIEQLSLDAGAGTQTDYLQAEAALLVARASLAEARYREIAARVELARIAGALTLEWLARNLEVAS